MMHIRHAIPADIERCLQLDASFETARVWQLKLRDGREQISSELRAVPLPRQLRVPFPTPDKSLLMHWQRGYCVLVADDPSSDQLLGYVNVDPEPDHRLGWVWHLVVGLDHRRQGVGTGLLQAAMQWSREHALRQVMVPVQAQNDPGIRFLQRNGFSFCGFNDRFYKSGDVALFFGRNLR